MPRPLLLVFLAFVLSSLSACAHAPKSTGNAAHPEPYQTKDGTLGKAFMENSLRWRLMTEVDGIRIYRDLNAPLARVELRAQTTVHAGIAKIATALTEPSERTKWMDGLVESRVIKNITEYERVEYSKMKAHYPYQFVDFVYRMTFSILRNPRTLLIRMASTADDASVPVPEASVRGRIVNSYQFATELDSDHTELAFEMGMDANGGFPSWDSQKLVVQWFEQTVKNLKATVENPKYGISAKVQAFMASHEL